eukprot:486177-Prymnesium_polylepis.1
MGTQVFGGFIKKGHRRKNKSLPRKAPFEGVARKSLLLPYVHAVPAAPRSVRSSDATIPQQTMSRYAPESRHTVSLGSHPADESLA